MTTFKKEHGGWKQYRNLPGVVEFDLHFSECGPRQIEYMEAMVGVWDLILQSTQERLREKHAVRALYTWVDNLASGQHNSTFPSAQAHAKQRGDTLHR